MNETPATRLQVVLDRLDLRIKQATDAGADAIRHTVSITDLTQVQADIRAVLADVDRLSEREAELVAENETLVVDHTAWDVAAETLNEQIAGLQDDLDATEQIHARRLSEFAPILDDLHRQAHGDDTGWRVCLREPCAGLHNVMPNALGKQLTT